MLAHVLIQWCLVSTSVFFSVFFHTQKSQPAVQPEINNSTFREHTMVDICVLIMSLHLWLLMSCLHEMCACWRKTMSATMTRWRGRLLECNEYINSVQTSGALWVRVSRRAECYPAPSPLQGNEWGWYTERGQHSQINRFYHRKWNLFSQS